MAKICLDESLNEAYPSREFCKENCKTSAFDELIKYEEENKFWLSEGTKPSAHRHYWRKMSYKRIVIGCESCRESLKYFSEKEKLNLQKEIKLDVLRMR